jgi:hypothetical protein
MDQPNSPQHLSITIPCDADQNYDGLDLASYPERQGWFYTISEWREIFTNPSSRLHALLQTWLFFGLLEQSVNFVIERHQLFVENLSTPDGCIDMMKVRSILEKAFRYNGIRKTRGTLDTVLEVLRALGSDSGEPEENGNQEENPHSCSLIQYITESSVQNPLKPEVAMSIALIIDTLFTAFQLSPSRTRESHLAVHQFRHNLFPRLSFIPHRMKTDGWCPYHISILHERLNTSALCFVSNCQRPSPGRVHTTSHNGPNRCNHYGCAHTKLSPDSYRTKHVEGCEGCPDMVANREQVHSILMESETFPLILSIDEAEETSEVTLVEYAGEHTRYVAISHVWSDGLGNLQRNALPRCQMRRLSRFVRNMPGNAENIVLFWLDTLCIPPDPIDPKKARGEQELREVTQTHKAQGAALNLMRNTYQNAQAVLVLDSWLLDQPVEHLTNAETLLRILSSHWNSRLWTLQEGALAKNLFFQFVDRAYNSEQGIDDMLEENLSISVVTLHSTIVQNFQDIRSLAWSGEQNLIAWAHALQIRSTSVQEDEALCLGALMNLDLTTMVKAQPDKRMEIFWTGLKSVPAAIIFYRGNKFDVPGWRWAPRSFLRPKCNAEDYPNELPLRSQYTMADGQVTQNGLKVEYPGLELYITNINVVNALKPMLGFVCLRGRNDVFFICSLPLIHKPEHVQHIFHEDHQRYIQMLGNGAIGLDYDKLLSEAGVPRTAVKGGDQRTLHVILRSESDLDGDTAGDIQGLLALPSSRSAEQGVTAVNALCSLTLRRYKNQKDFIMALGRITNDKTDGHRYCIMQSPQGDAYKLSSNVIIPVFHCVRKRSKSWCVD